MIQCIDKCVLVLNGVFITRSFDLFNSDFDRIPSTIVPRDTDLVRILSERNVLVKLIRQGEDRIYRVESFSEIPITFEIQASNTKMIDTALELLSHNQKMYEYYMSDSRTMKIDKCMLDMVSVGKSMREHISHPPNNAWMLHFGRRPSAL